VDVIFVGGIHGVGKSTCCQRASERTGLLWLTASALIKSERESAIAESSKEVLDVAGNQELLIRGLDKRVRSGHERVILDGHFTLLKSGGEIIAVEQNVFRQLGLEKIVVFRDDPTSICDRLRERDGKEWSISVVQVHQDAELEQGRRIALNLGISFITLDAFDADGLVRAIGMRYTCKDDQPAWE
jgi:adenylate kinase